MKKPLIIFISILFVLTSCIVEDPTTAGDYYIINNTDYKILINNYVNGEVVDTIFLNKDETEEYHFGDQGYTPSPPYFMADSSEVVFGNTVSIMHYPDGNQGADSSILVSKSWMGGKVSAYRYEFKYIFNDEDYKVAIDNSGYKYFRH